MLYWLEEVQRDADLYMWLLIALKQMLMEKYNIFWLNYAVIKVSLCGIVIFVWKMVIADQMPASHFILSRGQSNRPSHVEMMEKELKVHNEEVFLEVLSYLELNFVKFLLFNR